MARESQGLQVLLIVFVMLAVVLGVTTYLYSKRAEEATKSFVAETETRKKVEGQEKTVEEERDLLKTLIGLPGKSIEDIKKAQVEDIKKQFDEDMQAYGNGKKPDEGDKAGGGKSAFDSGTLFYHNLVASMSKTIQDRTDELLKSKAQVAEQDRVFKDREAAKDAQIKEFTSNAAKMHEDVSGITTDFKESQEATQKERDRIAGQVTDISKAAAQDVAKHAATAKASIEQVQKKEKEITDLISQIKKVDRPEMDAPSGEITWVSVANNAVWINRGRADALQRGTKFTVYGAESNSAAKAVKKGAVEVTRIEGDHSAQCRILEDKIADPILAGDKVFTPLWSPGQQNHFALAGIMNLDGDGRNQVSVVRGLINQNGGAVDCWLDEHGHKQGQVTADTRLIVNGDPPDKGSAECMKNNADILRDAVRYQLTTIPLSDFKRQMGYQKSSSVEHFGSGTTTDDVSRAASAVKKQVKAPAKTDEDTEKK